MSASSRWGRRVAALFLPCLLAACQSLSQQNCDTCADRCPKVLEPKVLLKPTVYAAAHDLDHLERHIDWHGSVTAAVPGVWGQARLQQYREQFEEQMYKDLDGFQESLQGSLARSDQALAVSTTALSLAINSKAATTTVPAGNYLTQDANGVVSEKELKQSVQQVVVPQAAIPLGYTVTEKDGKQVLVPLTDSSQFFTAPQLGFQADRFKAAFTTGATKDDKIRISLEPERVLEQKKRYLDLLANIRRTNEGDDTADAPGYSLQLLRIPVSVLPGKRTDIGFGAEITMTLAPELTDDLLPTTFRGLVINNLVTQLGFPITQALNPGNSDDFKKLITPQAKFIIDTTTLISDYLVTGDEGAARTLVKQLGTGGYKTVLAALDPTDRAVLFALLNGNRVDYKILNATRVGIPLNNLIPEEEEGSIFTQTARRVEAAITGQPEARPQRDLMLAGRSFRSEEVARKGLSLALSLPVVSFAPGTENRTALPASQLVDVYGTSYTFEIALAARQAFENDVRVKKYAHLPDVQAFLKEELNAAYDLLANPHNTDLWNFCQPELVHLVRTQAYDKLDEKRREFRTRVAALAGSKPTNPNRPDAAQMARSAAFAWAILIDAALLNDKLCREMKLQAARGGCAAPAQDWLPMYVPHPRPEDCRAFADYVKARWPIQVFALDPMIQEQNLADRLSTRRELQLALSMAFVSGRMNFNQFNRYARRLEAEYETIDVNRTAVGFNHGPDTFGWRFYPRFQTPDTPSNVELIGRDLLLGGPNKNQLLRERRLEPGPRECVALVVMPSFVPAVRIDSTSNFFPITNPKHKVFDHTDAVRLGRTVKALTTVGLSDAHCYRDGDAERLVKRARQLEARLPMQTHTFPVPTESSLGGFELFHTGTRSLAPELYGFYGAPGVDARKSTTLFLVGDHFSPLRTKVLVGNKQPTKVTLLSRQVAQVELSPDLVSLGEAGTPQHVSVHVATPYGVSRDLLVPVVDSSKAQPDGYYLAAESRVAIEVTTTANGTQVTAAGAASGAIVLRPKFASGANPGTVRVGIVGQTETVDVQLAPNGTYILSAMNVSDLIGQWFQKYVPTDKLFASGGEAVALVPSGLRLAVLPVATGTPATAKPTTPVFDLLPVDAKLKK